MRVDTWFERMRNLAEVIVVLAIVPEQPCGAADPPLLLSANRELSGGAGNWFLLSQCPA